MHNDIQGLFLPDLYLVDDERALKNGIEGTHLRNWNFHTLERVNAWCAQRAHLPAVSDCHRTVTYGELDAAADDLAVDLQSNGVVRGDLVCVIGQRSVEFVIAVLAIWRCGAAYVPLAGDTPSSRMGAVFAQTSSRVAIALDDAVISAWPADLKWPPLLGLTASHQGRRPQRYEALRDDVAYVIFTSGSSGDPKGVVIGHDSLADVVSSYCEHHRLTREDRMSAVANIAFDASVIEFWPALSIGSVVHVASPELVRSPRALMRWLGECAISHCWLPTPLVEILIGDDDLVMPASLRRIETAGQRLHLRPRGWAVSLVNSYGPTEATVIATSSPVLLAGDTTGNEDAPDIGRALPGVLTYILGEDRKLVASGEAGQLHIGGIGVGRGYLGRPDLTQACFLQDPFANVPGARMYATGDLCRLNQAGNLEFIGRIDNQVKLRGHRVELGEIELALTRVDGVIQAGCALVEVHGRQRLVACYTTRYGEAIDEDRARRKLASQLPDYMLPDAWVHLDELPLTANGKLDRARLGTGEMPGTPTGIEPLDPAQLRFLKWYGDTTGLTIGWDQPFIQAGGNSIEAILFIDAIRREYGTSLDYADFICASTPAMLHDLLRLHPNKDSSVVQIDPVASDGAVPMSVSQQAVWFLANMAPQDRAYHAKARLIFDGHVCARTMQLALQDIVDRHEIYRTSFTDHQGVPTQHIHPPYRVDLAEVDLREASWNETSEEAIGIRLDELLLGQINDPFQIDRLPLVRWSLVYLPGNRAALLHIEHHLVHDGWSHNVFVHELLEHYSRRRVDPHCAPDMARPTQYADFCIAQQRWLKTPAARHSESFWRVALKGAPSSINLPSTGDRGATDGQTIRVPFPRTRWQHLEAFCRNAGCTPFSFVLSAFSFVLSRASGDDDICVGSAFANRSWAGAADVIGMMINTVVLRCRPDPDSSVTAFLTNNLEVCNDAQVHQAFPFERVVQSLAPQREPGVNPLFQVFLGFHDSPLPKLQVAGVNAIGLKEAVDSQSAKFDLSLVVIPRAGQEGEDDPVHMLWEFKRSRFAPWFVESLISAFAGTVDAFLGSPEAPLRSIAVCGPTTERREAGAPETDVVTRILDVAKRHPNRVAIEFDGQVVRYQALVASICSKAGTLRESGVARGDLVGVCLPRSPDLVAWLLAVQWVGAGYVPMDPDYPAERLRHIVEHSQPRCVVGGGDCHAFAGDYGLLLPGGTGDHHQTPPPLPCVGEIAYVIYTSGSTGKPKGVVVSHQNLGSLLTAMVRACPFQSDSRLLAVTSCSFDISVLELFLPLTLGARLVLATEEDVRDAGRLAALIESSGATHLQATPSTWRALMETSCIIPTGFIGLCGGEALDTALARHVLSRGVRLYNLYGPTETTIWSCVHEVTEDDDPVPIGRPLGNTEVHVLDHYGMPALHGAVGQLWIGGEGVASGYLNEPALTSERFLVPPSAGGRVLYSTGDLVSIGGAGELFFHGRNDHQVKVRGFRIELAEIEARIREIAWIREIVVAAHGPSGATALVAYFVPTATSPAVEEAIGTLTQHCVSTLPAYMVPSQWVCLDEMPKTPNGKTDRSALYPSSVTDAQPARSASTPTERAVSAIYADLLRIPEVNVSTSFMAQGGHSLLAMQVVARINREFAMEMRVVEFLRLSSVCSVAGEIDRLQSGQRQAVVEEIVL